jgi:predicted DNA-binding transcriptional regulator AlpA
MIFADSTYINRSQLADELGVSIATIRNWSKQDGFPSPVNSSGKIPIYRTKEIISWLESEVRS